MILISLHFWNGWIYFISHFPMSVSVSMCGAHVDIRMPLWSHFSPPSYFKFKLPGLPGKCFCALSYLASLSCVLCLGKQKTLCVPALLQAVPPSSPRTGSKRTSPYWKTKRGGVSPQGCHNHTAYHFKMLDRKGFQVHNKTD